MICMKPANHPLRKRLLGLCLAVSMLLSLTPTVSAVPSEEGESTSNHGQIAPLSQEYVEYIENGGTGSSTPSTMDLSYLEESYEQQNMQRNALLPQSFDLRDYGRAPTVKDQGSYGTCWTFATLGSAESGLIEQMPDISLSNIHLAWFNYTGDEEEEYTWLQRQNNGSSIFDMGGNDPQAVGSLAAWKGPVDSETVPYDTTEVDESLRWEADYHLQDAFYMSNGSYGYGEDNTPYPSIQTIKQILMDYGAVSISYSSSAEDAYNEETYAVYSDTYLPIDHAVLIVGWDDNFSRENFNEDQRPEEDGAWLIRNSWGSSWGDDGYFWLSYEDQTLQYGNYYSLEEADNYQNNYQYDTLGWGISVSADTFIDEEKASRTGYMSNIFTSEGDEQLEAVSFYTTDAGTSYEISVYTGVQQGDPTSGQLVYSGHTGAEEYAGYHTIELNKAISLEKGETFSVVVKLTNPNYAYPIPVEICPLPYSKSEPEYMGDGGESYYSLDGQSWNDITELSANYSDFHIYTTNACVKAFTNPIPDEGEAIRNVQFSLLEGPVISGDKLELTGEGEIYYQITGSDGTVGEITPYTGAITLEGPCTVSAWGQKNGKQGNVVSRTYTQAVSQLLDLDVDEEGKHIKLDVSEDETAFGLTTDSACEEVRIRPRGSDILTVNGVEVASDEWSDAIALEPGKITSIEVTSQAGGKTSTTYTIDVYRSILVYDYYHETVSYDDTLYTLQDGEGNVITNGASITPYVVEEGQDDVVLTAIAKDGSGNLEELVPKRPVAVGSAIDFENECTVSTYGDWNEIADNPDMIGAEKGSGESIPVTPGKDIYIRKYATDTSFQSKVVCIQVPDSRPDTPVAKVQSVAPTSITVQPVEGGEYRILPDGEWQEENTLTNLEMNTNYTIEVRIKATENSFASEAAQTEATTTEGLIIPVSYQYKGKEIFWDEFTAVPGVNIVTADQEVLEQASVVLENPEQNQVQVTVTQKDGQLVADVSSVVFSIVPTIDPQSFYFEVSYWDQDGNRVEGGGKQTFDTIGAISRESIPLPYGYQEIIPAHPDESWLYPTGLYYGVGGWFVYPQTVNVIVEKMASVTVTFQQEDGSVLGEEELYFGEEGAGLQKVTAPEGYKIAGEDTFALEVTRDENGHLVADPTQVTFTVQPDVDPSQYFYTVRYEDGEGNAVPGGGKLYFDAVGPVSREDIPMPYGYQQLVPAHPDEDWLYPTALVCIDGQWQASVDEVVIQVEKMAKVDVTFKTQDGTSLSDLGYELFYGEEGEETVTVAVPEGYELVGEETAQVIIARDEQGVLTATPSEVTFVIEKTQSSHPDDPSKPVDPSTPGGSGGSDNPSTGEGTTAQIVLVILFVSAAGLLTALLIRRKRTV